MKRVIFTTIVCAFVAAPAMADFYGGQVYYNRIGGYYSGQGGEFTLSSDGGLGLLLNLSAYKEGVTKNVTGSTAFPSFQTFCVEGTEYVASPMEMMVSTTFVDESIGGVTGPGSHAILGSMTYGDNLDPMTAYLYTKFATGTLDGYNYGAGRSISADALQKAIWYIEGESGGVNNTFATLALDAVTSGEWVGMGIGDVRILNTWVVGHIGDPDFKLQDQLYLVPVPAAVLLGLLGLGVAGWKLRRFA